MFVTSSRGKIRPIPHFNTRATHHRRPSFRTFRNPIQFTKVREGLRVPRDTSQVRPNIPNRVSSRRRRADPEKTRFSLSTKSVSQVLAPSEPPIPRIAYFHSTNDDLPRRNHRVRRRRRRFGRRHDRGPGQGLPRRGRQIPALPQRGVQQGVPQGRRRGRVRALRDGPPHDSREPYQRVCR